MATPTLDTLLQQAQQIVTDLTAFKPLNDAALAAKDQKISDLTSLIGGFKTRAQDRKDADAAKVDGQDDLDAIAQAGF